MTRTYECRNRDCPNFAVRIHVRGRPLGDGRYVEYPNIRCADCDHEPPITELNGKPVEGPW